MNKVEKTMMGLVASLTLGVSAIGTGAAVQASTEAQVAVDPDVAYFQNTHTLRCLEDTSWGTTVTSCMGFKQHKWAISVVNRGKRLQSEQTGECLQDNGREVVTAPCDDALLSQIWYFPKGGVATPIKNRATEQCLDDTFEAGLVSYACHYGKNQIFWMVDAG